MPLLREPLLHFLLIGALLFAADAALRDDPAPSGQVIRITAAEIDRLQAQWTRQYQRPPAPLEMQDLIDARVREEVLFREALAMGLDQDDEGVRRRLAQKLEFLIEDLAVAQAPGEAELGAFFAANPERYRQPPQVSFSHVFFSPERRGDSAAADARVALAGLRPETRAAQAADLGDRLLVGESYADQTPQDVAAVFGPDFAGALLELEPGGWRGPIASAYGWHLVRIEARSEGRLPPLAAVADQVRHDWAYEQRRRANEAVFTQLLARYELTIEDEGLSRPAGSGGEQP
jgi:peptidyl-prolyl cis-trans isomerase C